MSGKSDLQRLLPRFAAISHLRELCEGGRYRWPVRPSVSSMSLLPDNGGSGLVAGAGAGRSLQLLSDRVP